MAVASFVSFLQIVSQFSFVNSWIWLSTSFDDAKLIRHGLFRTIPQFRMAISVEWCDIHSRFGRKSLIWSLFTVLNTILVCHSWSWSQERQMILRFPLESFQHWKWIYLLNISNIILFRIWLQWKFMTTSRRHEHPFWSRYDMNDRNPCPGLW